jgi:ligand-binding SRPBCC domain-containing protein
VPVDVVTETVIARPRDEVAAYACDPDNATQWYENIKSVEWRSPRPLAVGTRLAFVASFLGRRLEYTYEVREYAPGERFVMSTAEGPFPM